MLKKGTFNVAAAIPYIIWSMLFFGMLFSYVSISYGNLKIQLSEEEENFQNEIIFREIINCISKGGILMEDAFESQKVKKDVSAGCFPKQKSFRLLLDGKEIYADNFLKKNNLEYTKPIARNEKIFPGTRGIASLKLIIEKRGEASLEL